MFNQPAKTQEFDLVKEVPLFPQYTIQHYLRVSELAFNSESIDPYGFGCNQCLPGIGECVCVVGLVADLSLGRLNDLVMHTDHAYSQRKMKKEKQKKR